MIDSISIDSKLARPAQSGPLTIDITKMIPIPIVEATAPVITEQPTVEEKSVTKSTKNDDACCPIDEETK